MRIERLLADDIDDIDDVEEDDRLRMSAFDAKEPARLRIPTRRPDTFEIRGFDEWRQDELLIRGAYWLQMNVRYVSGEELADFQLHPYAKVLDFKNELTQAGLDEHWFDQHQIAMGEDVLYLCKNYFQFNPWAPYRPISRIFRKELGQDEGHTLTFEAVAVRVPSPVLRDCQDCGNIWPEDRWIWAKCWKEITAQGRLHEGDPVDFRPTTTHSYCETTCSMNMSCPDTSEVGSYLMRSYQSVDIIDNMLSRTYKGARDFGNDSGYDIVDDFAWRIVAFFLGSHDDASIAWSDAMAYVESCNSWCQIYYHDRTLSLDRLWACRRCDPRWLGWNCWDDFGCQRSIPPWKWTPLGHFGTCSHIVAWRTPPGQMCGCCRAKLGLPIPCDHCNDFHMLKCTCKRIEKWVMMKRWTR